LTLVVDEQRLRDAQLVGRSLQPSGPAMNSGLLAASDSAPAPGRGGTTTVTERTPLDG
jgi:hypothetical protein